MARIEGTAIRGTTAPQSGMSAVPGCAGRPRLRAGLFAGAVLSPLLSAAAALAGIDDPVAIRNLGGGGFLLEPLFGPSVLLRPISAPASAPSPVPGVAGSVDVAVIEPPDTNPGAGSAAAAVLPRGEFIEFDVVASGPAASGAGGTVTMTGVRVAMLRPGAAGSAGEADNRNLAGVRTRLVRSGTALVGVEVATAGLRVLHVSPGGAATLAKGAPAELAGADVLLLPVGTTAGVTPAESLALVGRLAPTQFVIPYLHQPDGMAAPARPVVPGRPAPAGPVGELLALAAAARHPVARSPTDVLLVDVRNVLAEATALVPVRLRPVMVELTAGTPASDPAREAILAPVRKARRAVWEAVAGLSAAELDARNQFLERPIRSHLEHCIGRDLADLSRAAVRMVPGCTGVAEWSMRPGPEGWLPRTTGRDAAELLEASRRAESWGESLAPLLRLQPPEPPPPAPGANPGAGVINGAGNPAAPKTVGPDSKSSPAGNPPAGADPKAATPAANPAALPPIEPPPLTLPEVAETLEWTWKHHAADVRRRLAELEAARRPRTPAPADPKAAPAPDPKAAPAPDPKAAPAPKADPKSAGKV